MRYISTGRWLPLLLAALLAGCGWHLRGAVTLPPLMQTTYLSGVDPHGPLGTDIATALASADARLVDSPEAAGAVLNILGQQFNRRVLTVNREGRVSEYELHYDLRYRLESRAGKVLVPAQTASVIRSYSFNAANVLGSGGEEDLLRQEMRTMAVNQMLRRLQAAAAALPAKDEAGQGK